MIPYFAGNIATRENFYSPSNLDITAIDSAKCQQFVKVVLERFTKVVLKLERTQTPEFATSHSRILKSFINIQPSHITQSLSLT